MKNRLLTSLLSFTSFLLISGVSEQVQAAESLVQTNNGPYGINVSNSGSGLQFNNFLVGDLFNNRPPSSGADMQKFLSAIRKEQRANVRKRDPLFVKLERYLVASNPTEIDLKKITTDQWLGDDEPSITVRIANLSNLPAEKVSVRVLIPLKAGQKNSEAIVFSKSRAIPANLRQAIYIPQRSETVIPIGLVSEVVAALNHSGIEDYEFIGVGNTPNLPADIADAFSKKSEHVSQEGSQSHMVGFANRVLGVEVKYKTIFDQELTCLFPIHFYFGKDEMRHVVKPVVSENN